MKINECICMIPLKNKRYVAYIIGIAFFFCIYQYHGVLVDAILYTLQAVHYMYPERLTGDISFAYGNQDSFSIFSPIYAVFLRLFSVELGAKFFCILSHIVFAIASISLLDFWTRKRHCNFALLPLMLVFFYLYGYGENRAAIGIFNYVEPYINPRILSVACGLFGLSQIFYRKKLSLIFFLVGTLIHPLMAGWGIPLWLFYYYPKTIIPISLLSFLFPLSIFIGKVPFCSYDLEWMDVSLRKTYFLHFASFLAFFIYCWKTNENLNFKRVAKSLSFLVMIALYWHVIGHYTGHVFLTQVQTFRIEWLCVATAYPLCFIKIFELWLKKIRRKISLTTIERAFFVFPLAFWIDSCLIDAFFIFFLLQEYFRKAQKEKILKIILNCSQIISLFGLIIIFIFTQQDLSTANKVLVRNMQEYMSYFAILVTLMKLIFTPQSKVLSIFVLVIVALSNITREKIMFSLDLSYSITVLAATLFWIQNFNKKYLTLVPLVWLIPYALLFYDIRGDEQVEAEKEIDTYLDKPIFPEISDRGRMLFCVSGYHLIIPRIHFLSGAYLDRQSDVGGIFIRNQEIEFNHRYRMLFYEGKEGEMDVSGKAFIDNFKKLHSSKQLEKTASFLCKKNEILNLVTDIPGLRMPVINSTLVGMEKKQIFLYGCNEKSSN